MLRSCDLPSLQWKYTQVSEFNSSVPDTPRIYAIGYNRSLHGFELNRFYVLVREILDLERCLDEHFLETEENPASWNWVRNSHGAKACWFIPVRLVYGQLFKSALSAYLNYNVNFSVCNPGSGDK